MNTSKLADIAEITGTIAIVLSLIFVGIQVRNGNREVRAATIQSSLNLNMDMSIAFADHAATWDKVLNGEPLASGEELRQGIVLYNMLIADSENRFLQSESGYLDPQAWESRHSTLRRVVGLPIFEIWRNSPGGNSHPADFLEILDEMAVETHQ